MKGTRYNTPLAQRVNWVLRFIFQPIGLFAISGRRHRNEISLGAEKITSTSTSSHTVDARGISLIESVYWIMIAMVTSFLNNIHQKGRGGEIRRWKMITYKAYEFRNPVPRWRAFFAPMHENTIFPCNIRPAVFQAIRTARRGVPGYMVHSEWI